jgi:predicted dehydrogenase
VKIGIIGSENSHTIAIAKTINIDKRVPGFTVDYVWGETDELAQKAAAEGQIPNIVADSISMLGKVDAVLVDHRHAKYHLEAVWPFVDKGVPTFVDKPFCYRSEEGRRFLDMANERGTPVTSFGVVPRQASVAGIKSKLATLGAIQTGTTYGPCDIESEWGGVFFYGVHQVELALDVFGYDVSAAVVTRNGDNAAGQLLYPSGLVVTMALVKDNLHTFGVSAVGLDGIHIEQVVYDADAYLAGIQTFTTMFKTGVRPFTDEQLLKPIQVLEALERSIESGKVEVVG